jgi:hypothetical protein
MNQRKIKLIKTCHVVPVKHWRAFNLFLNQIKFCFFFSALKIVNLEMNACEVNFPRILRITFSDEKEILRWAFEWMVIDDDITRSDICVHCLSVSIMVQMSLVELGRDALTSIFFCLLKFPERQNCCNVFNIELIFFNCNQHHVVDPTRRYLICNRLQGTSLL